MIAAVVFASVFAATPFEDAAGFALEPTDSNMSVTKVAKNSAADDAGLAATDLIVHVDGKAVAGMKVEELSEFVKQKGGTTHRIVVKRDGKSKLVVLKLDKPV